MRKAAAPLIASPRRTSIAKLFPEPPAQRVPEGMPRDYVITQEWCRKLQEVWAASIELRLGELRD